MPRRYGKMRNPSISAYYSVRKESYDPWSKKNLVSVRDDYREQYLQQQIQQNYRQEDWDEWDRLREARLFSEREARRAQESYARWMELKNPPAQNPTTPTGDAEQERANRSINLKKSLMVVGAISVTARTLFSYGCRVATDIYSTDTVRQKLTAYKSAEAVAGLGLTMINPALGMAFSLVKSVVDKHITNSIQRKGDRKRVAYGFANYDLGKYGTYAYDNTSQEWVAQDANKVKARTLGQKQSV